MSHETAVKSQLVNGLDMNDSSKRGIRNIYWDLGLKMSVIKLRKHRESINFQFLTYFKMSVACGIPWVEN